MAAEEGEVAVAYLGGLAEGAAALAPTAGEVAGTLAGAGSWRGGNGGAGRGHCGRRSLRPRARYGLGAGEHALPGPTGQRGRGRAGRPVRQQHERRHAASALHAAHRQQHVRQPHKQPRLLAVRLPCAVQHAPFSGLNPVALPQSQNSWASSSSGQSRRSLPPPSRLPNLHGFALQNAITLVCTSMYGQE